MLPILAPLRWWVVLLLLSASWLLNVLYNRSGILPHPDYLFGYVFYYAPWYLAGYALARCGFFNALSAFATRQPTAYTAQRALSFAAFVACCLLATLGRTTLFDLTDSQPVASTAVHRQLLSQLQSSSTSQLTEPAAKPAAEPAGQLRLAERPDDLDARPHPAISRTRYSSFKIKSCENWRSLNF